MTKTQFVSLILTLFILNGCKKDQLSGSDKVAAGNWTWSFSECDCCEFPVNPTRVGYSLKLVLSDKGTYQLFKNDKKIEHGRLLKKDGLYTFIHNDIKRKDDLLNGHKITFLSHDTLKINLGVCSDNNYQLYLRQ